MIATLNVEWLGGEVRIDQVQLAMDEAKRVSLFDANNMTCSQI